MSRENFARRDPDAEDIIIVTYVDEKQQIRVSHGVGALSLRNHVLPNDLLSDFRKRWSQSLEEWVVA